MAIVFAALVPVFLLIVLGVYPSDVTPVSLSPTTHGNGFWNSGVMDAVNAIAAAGVRERQVRQRRASTVLLPDPPLHARDGQRSVRRADDRPCCSAGAARLLAAPAASAAIREYWVAAVPVTWNIVPNGRDAIMGIAYDPSADRLRDRRLPALHAALAHAAAQRAAPARATRT